MSWASVFMHGNWHVVQCYPKLGNNLSACKSTIYCIMVYTQQRFMSYFNQVTSIIKYLALNNCEIPLLAGVQLQYMCVPSANAKKLC